MKLFTFIILSAFFFQVYGQTSKTIKPVPILKSCSSYDVDQYVYIVNNRPISIDFKPNLGFFVYDISSQNKEVFVRGYDGIDTSRIKEAYPIYLGKIGNTIYFLIRYIPLNFQKFDQEFKAELWSYDGKNTKKISIPINAYNYMCEGTISGGISVIGNTDKFIFVRPGSNNFGKDSIAFLQFDGDEFKLVKNFDIGLIDEGSTIVQSFNNSILLASRRLDEPERSSKYILYNGMAAKVIDVTPVTNLNNSISACGNFFHFKEMRGPSCDSSECGYLSINKIGEAPIFSTPPQYNTLDKRALMPFGSKLIFGFYRDKTLEENGDPAKDTISGLYITDGTAKGTFQISNTIMQGGRPFSKYDESKEIISHAVYQSNLYFTLRSQNRETGYTFDQIWVTDGTKKGTRLVKTFEKNIGPIKVSKGKLIYAKAVTGVSFQLYTLENNIESLLTDRRIFDLESYDVLSDGKLYYIAGARNNPDLYIEDFNPKLTPVAIKCDFRTNASLSETSSRMLNLANRYKEIAIDNLKKYKQFNMMPVNYAKTCSYAKTYLSNPKLFKWAGLAALVSGRIGEESKSLISKIDNDFPIIEFTKQILDGNELVYMDLYWQHLLVKEHGIAGIKDALSTGDITQEVYNAWSKILSGVSEKIWEGNKELLFHEQKKVLQPMYDANPKTWTALSISTGTIAEKLILSLTSPVPNSKLVFPGGPYNKINIMKFGDRWFWIENTILPEWKKFESNPANKVILLNSYKKVCPNLN